MNKDSLAEALGLHTRQMAALIVTGHQLYQQGQIKDAAKIFEGIAVLDSSNPYVQGVLGSIYQKLTLQYPLVQVSQ